MMSRLMATHQLRPLEVDQLGGVLARFYAEAPRVPMDPTLWTDRYREEWATHHQVLLGPWGEGLVSAAWMDRAWGAQTLMEAALAQRCAQGAFVEGHGDLRPEHVCFWTSPVVIDALEFNARLRWVDPADELDYLALECEVLGAAWVGARLWSAWQAHAAHLDSLPTKTPQPLRHLYRLRRSLLRARLCIAHLMSPRPRTPQRWRPLARRYLRCADESLRAIELAANSPPMALDKSAPAETTVTF
jgi:aminoglycoside phosphotransferase family enzyme